MRNLYAKKKKTINLPPVTNTALHWSTRTMYTKEVAACIGRDRRKRRKLDHGFVVS